MASLVAAEEVAAADSEAVAEASIKDPQNESFHSVTLITRVRTSWSLSRSWRTCLTSMRPFSSKISSKSVKSTKSSAPFVSIPFPLN